MIRWLKRAASDLPRMENNIKRLEDLKEELHQLRLFAPLSQSGAFLRISEIVDKQVVRGLPRVRDILSAAHIGDHHQKVALDAPQRFVSLIEEAEVLIGHEISARMMELKKLKKDL